MKINKQTARLLNILRKESSDQKFEDEYIIGFVFELVRSDPDFINTLHDTLMILNQTRPHLLDVIKKETKT